MVAYFNIEQVRYMLRNGSYKRLAVCHFGFLKIKFLTVGPLERSIRHHSTKFCGHQSYHCRDIAMFAFFSEI